MRRLGHGARCRKLQCLALVSQERCHRALLRAQGAREAATFERRKFKGAGHAAMSLASAWRQVYEAALSLLAAPPAVLSVPVGPLDKQLSNSASAFARPRRLLLRSRRSLAALR